MTLALVYSRATCGVSAPLVTVETHLARGLPKFNIVGLPEKAVKESKDRVRCALLNSRFEFPIKRITINLGPADLPKEGCRFDLPIALGILAASGQIPKHKLDHYEFIAELALSGELRPIHGVLPVVLGAYHAARQLIIPRHNAEEASLMSKAKVLSANHLLDVCAYLREEADLPICKSVVLSRPKITTDMSDVKGQHIPKRALEIAAAGNHSLLYIGPPGTGKTMLANRLPSILPELTEEQGLEVAAVNSISHHGFDPKSWKSIPFRTPHHSSSSVALVGGGRPPRPGEISLAHHGILFLDELPEFNRQVLESLREPLESGSITVSRAAFQTVFPANFQFIAAMNPCPCGYAGSMLQECRCTDAEIKHYLAKLSGPVLDRIDLQVEVPAISLEILTESEQLSETSADIKHRVIQAQLRQHDRQAKLNRLLTVPELQKIAGMKIKAEQLLAKAAIKFSLSARAYHRILKIARTIADLDKSDSIEEQHISEALTFRYFDRIRVGKF